MGDAVFLVANWATLLETADQPAMLMQRLIVSAMGNWGTSLLSVLSRETQHLLLWWVLLEAHLLAPVVR